LRDMATKIEWENDKIPMSKPILVKRIHEEMEKIGAKKFLDEIKNDVMEEIFKVLEIDKPSSKSKYVDALLEEADIMGVENILSSFSIPKLKEIAEECGLTVESGSKSVLIECIVAQENHKAPKKKALKPEKASKKKPDIKKGITKTDLNTHYYRQELQDYCKDNDLNTTGSKRDFISRILAHVEGREQPLVRKKPGSKRVKKRKGSDDEKDEKPKKKVKKNG